MKVHMGWWTPLAYWAPKCEKRWMCRDCTQSKRYEYVMPENPVRNGKPDDDDPAWSRVTCLKCLKKRKNHER